MYVDDIKLAGRTENIEPTWKILMSDVDVGEPTSFLDHVYWVCTQRWCQISKDVVANYRDMFETRISSGAKEKLSTRASGKPDAETVDRTPTHNTHLCSTVCSQARNASHALGSSHTDCSVIFVRLKIVLSSGVAHVSSSLVDSPAVYHEHIIFLIHSSFYHDTRTRSTTSTT